MTCRPDFFLIGAPKCGTTAMSEYLRHHPEICFSRPKEPFFFCTDLPTYRVVETEREYLDRCFGHCRSAHGAVGEGSATYLYSEVAVPNILAFEPDARFIVMVRNPIDVAHALHSQFVFDFIEDVEDFERAWHLQNERREGRHVPVACTEPQLLQYGTVAALGSQVERLLSRVRERHVHFVLFDDFMSDTKRMYEETIGFLGLPPDGRTSFPRVNRYRRHRWSVVGRLLKRPPRPVRRLVESVKRTAGVGSLGIARRIDALTTRPVSRAPLRPGFRGELLSAFSEEIYRLERALGRDLDAWRSIAEGEGE